LVPVAPLGAPPGDGFDGVVGAALSGTVFFSGVGAILPGSVVGFVGVVVVEVVVDGGTLSPSGGLLQPATNTEIVRPAASRPISFLI